MKVEKMQRRNFLTTLLALPAIQYLPIPKPKPPTKKILCWISFNNSIVSIKTFEPLQLYDPITYDENGRVVKAEKDDIVIGHVMALPVDVPTYNLPSISPIFLINPLPLSINTRPNI